MEQRLQILEQLIDTLFENIKHGDDAHQNWLKEAVFNHFNGLPMPKYVESGRVDLEQKIDILERRVAELERTSVKRHHNPWPDTHPYQPWSPLPHWPEVILTEQQKEGIRKMMEQFKKEKPVD